MANTYVETTILNQEETLVLRTKKENILCDYNYFDSLKVNITVDPKIYKLNYTNTSNINNNTYTWYLDRSNCNNSEIVLTLDKIKNIEDDIINPNENKDNELDKDIIKNNNKNNYTMYIFCGILIILILIGYAIFKKIKNKSESFGIDD